MLSSYNLDSLELEDPLDRINRRLARLGLSNERAKEPQAPKERLDEAETQSVLKSIGNVVLPPLAVVGNILDTPGAAIRGFLKRATSGKGLGEALAGGASDMFDWENRTSGRDLLRQWGRIGKEDNWKNFLGGLAADIALDPLTYTGFGLGGALTKAGKETAKVVPLKSLAPIVASKKASAVLRPELERLMATGLSEADALAQLSKNKVFMEHFGSTAVKTGGVKTGTRYQKNLRPMDLMDPTSPEYQLFERNVGGPQEAAKLLGQKIGATMSFGLPFSEKYRIAFDLPTGPLGALAENASRIAKTSRPGRVFGGLFNHEFKGTTGLKTQEAARGLWHAEDAATATARSQGMPFLWDFQDLIDSGKIKPEALDEALRYRLERIRPGFAPGAGSTVGADVKANLMALDPAQRRQFFKGVVKMRRLKDEYADAVRAAGGNVSSLTDEFASHFPRYSMGGSEAGFNEQRLFPTTFGSQARRKMTRREIPEGTAALNRMGRDPNLVGNAKLPLNQAAQRIQQVYGVTDVKQAERLAGALGSRAELGSLYGSPTHDLIRYLESSGRAKEGVNAVVDYVGKYARPITGAAGEKLVPLNEALAQIKGIQRLNRKGQVRGLTPDVIYQVKDAISRYKGVVPNKLKEFGIDPAELRDLTRFMPNNTLDDASGGLKQMAKSFTSLFKAGQTSLWPAFHARNKLSGVVNAMLANIAPDPKTYLAAYQLLTKGKGVAEALQYPQIRQMLAERGINNPTTKDVTRLLQESTLANDVIGMYRGPAHSGVGFEGTEQFASSVPGLVPSGGLASLVGSGFKEGKGNVTSLSGLKELFGGVRGVGGRTETTSRLFKAGENVGWHTESMLRLPEYMSLLKRGYSAKVAAEKVGQANVRYGGRYFTPFENDKLRWLIPFWGFQKGMTQHVGRELAAHPGGRYGQMIRLENRLQEHASDLPLPDYISQATAMPWMNQPDNGDIRILGGLNMMHDPALGYLAPLMAAPFDAAGMFSEKQRGNIGRRARAGLQEIIGQTNPLFKAPIEWASGRSFFQKGPEGGRDIADMDPLLARTISNVRETFGGAPGDPEAHIDPKTGKPIARPLPWTANFWEHILANSPASRALSTVRVAFDPRKTAIEKLAQLGAGLRVNDISQAAIETVIREAAATRLGEYPFAKSHEKAYIPLDILAQLDPQSDPVLLDALLKGLSRRTQLRAKGKDLPLVGQGPLVPF